MKIQRTPIILLAIAAVLGGTVYFLELNKATAPETTQATQQKLFPFQEADVQALTVTTILHTLSFTKVPANTVKSPAPAPSPSPTTPASPMPEIWLMTAPDKTPASEGAIAFLLNLVGSGSYEKKITVPVAQLGEFGFNTPQATVDITLKDQKKHQIILGEADFNRSFLYAQIDPDPQAKDRTVYLVSLDFENAVNRPLAEWKESSAPRPTASPLPAPPQPTPTPTKP